MLVGVVNNTKVLGYILEESYLEEEGEGNREKQIKVQQDLEILEQRQTDHKQLHESGTDASLVSNSAGQNTCDYSVVAFPPYVSPP